ncbi:calcium/calmodulin-dependent protein kinase type 1 (camki) [Reticulomyxa filosa]|uniref:Calcium/calmodulin-dependent protein kinase type 1 (Camki) n=1 Tax=Reticulomyxa filosa TaxID=46433 RepID=X6NUR9_RETFI|nr:calcium/calmodulin-dependent protein kinase type 1 (camki) [Reticulomyxa filosa]|eukprot:ETO29007.1 calcium/calmodulin-dependent protein kinase type 1 (camki) [Reticulomyxa filosa]
MYGMIIRGQYRFPSPHWDHVSEQAKDCVRNLMCVDPKKRFNCSSLLTHKFIQTNVDLEELAQQEKQLLAHEKELIKTDLPDKTTRTPTNTTTTSTTTSTPTPLSSIDKPPPSKKEQSAATNNSSSDIDSKTEDL